MSGIMPFGYSDMNMMQQQMGAPSMGMPQGAPNSPTYTGQPPSGIPTMGGSPTYAKGGRVAARMVQKAGMRGDNILAHINPEEARMLALRHGMDINPMTGLPQYGLYDYLNKGANAIGGYAKNFGQGLWNDYGHGLAQHGLQSLDTGIQGLLPTAGTAFGSSFGPGGAALGGGLGALLATKYNNTGGLAGLVMPKLQQTFGAPPAGAQQPQNPSFGGMMHEAGRRLGGDVMGKVGNLPQMGQDLGQQYGPQDNGAQMGRLAGLGAQYGLQRLGGTVSSNLNQDIQGLPMAAQQFGEQYGPAGYGAQMGRMAGKGMQYGLQQLTAGMGMPGGYAKGGHVQKFMRGGVPMGFSATPGQGSMWYGPSHPVVQQREEDQRQAEAQRQAAQQAEAQRQADAQRQAEAARLAREQEERAEAFAFNIMRNRTPMVNPAPATGASTAAQETPREQRETEVTRSQRDSLPLSPVKRSNRMVPPVIYAGSSAADRRREYGDEDEDMYDIPDYDEAYMKNRPHHRRWGYAKGGQVDGLRGMADSLKHKGTGGDDILAHINPEEAMELENYGGSSVNPSTGLPEFGFFRKMEKSLRSPFKKSLPFIGAAIGNAILPGAGGAIGGALGGGLADRKHFGKGAMSGALKGAAFSVAAPTLGGMFGASAGSTGGNMLGMGPGNWGMQSGGGLRSLMGGAGGASRAGTMNQLAQTGAKFMPGGDSSSSGMGGGLINMLGGPLNAGLLGTSIAGLAMDKRRLSKQDQAAQDKQEREEKRMEQMMQEQRDYRNPADSLVPNDFLPHQRAKAHPEDFDYEDTGYQYFEPVRHAHGGPIHDYAHGGYLDGDTDGQADDIDAKLSDGEYVIDASTVSDLGNGNNAAGAHALKDMVISIRKHKRKMKGNGLPPKAKSIRKYMKSGGK